jgi:hypothetical protein
LRKELATRLILCLAVVSFFALLGSVKALVDTQNRIAELEYLLVHSHSGMAGIAIEELEAKIPAQVGLIVLFCATTGILLILTALRVRNERISAKLTAALPLMFLIAFPSFFHPTGEGPPHFYSRVEMTVEDHGDFDRIEGNFNPSPASYVHTYWICYHIGIYWDNNNWIGGGWTSDVAEGNVTYLEINENGRYYEEFGMPIRYIDTYTVRVCKWHSSAGNWLVAVMRRGWVAQLEICTLPSSGTFKAVAGGESLTTDNSMSTTFSNLWYNTTHGNGYWTGVPYPCEIIRDYPYSLELTIPYYAFTVCVRPLLAFSHGANGAPPKGNVYR